MYIQNSWAHSKALHFRHRSSGWTGTGKGDPNYYYWYCGIVRQVYNFMKTVWHAKPTSIYLHLLLSIRLRPSQSWCSRGHEYRIRIAWLDKRLPKWMQTFVINLIISPFSFEEQPWTEDRNIPLLDLIQNISTYYSHLRPTRLKRHWTMTIFE